jgi:hypothetical protein
MAHEHRMQRLRASTNTVSVFVACGVTGRYAREEDKSDLRSEGP